jgi:hypothetical protein
VQVFGNLLSVLATAWFDVFFLCLILPGEVSGENEATNDGNNNSVFFHGFTPFEKMV